MSTADWPAAWGKDYEALLCVLGLFAHQLKSGNVQLWRNLGSGLKPVLIGVVSEDVPYTTLRDSIPLMFDSYQRGVADGRAALAAEVLAPISEALKDRSTPPPMSQVG